MSTELDRDIQLLDSILADVLQRLGPPEHTELSAQLLHACTMGEQDRFAQARAQIAKLSTDEIRELVKSLTLRFHLRNQAEKVAIVRINRRRRREATEDRPRSESIAEAISRLKRRSLSLEELLDVVKRIDIQPTLTAHPTESRRRTLLRKQRDIAECLIELNEKSHEGAARRQAEEKLRQIVLLHYGTDEVRIERISVLEEIEGSLHFLTTAIWDAVPRIMRDLESTVEQYYGKRPELPPVIRYRTWIGGDRDGNPLVTPAMTRQSLRLHRQSAIDLYREKVAELSRLLSLSDQSIPMPAELTASVQPEQLADIVPEESMARLRHEPFRLKLLQMNSRLAAAIDDNAAYSASEFEKDLRLLSDSLRQMKLAEIAESSGLMDLITQVRIFGFHLAALDIRQHSDVHEQVVDELLAQAGLCQNYRTLSESDKTEILTRTMDRPQIDDSVARKLTALSRDLLDVLHIIVQARRHDPPALGSYVISMAGAVSDVLEVLWLMRSVGLDDLDIVPLFETIDDLERAPDLLHAMLTNPTYRAHVERRENFQEIMLGYSDSNKDGGYLMSGWLLHNAQSRLAAVCRSHDINFRFFHGRGGTVGRGGGRSNRAILATPRDSRSGRIRMTEQGEVVSFRYGLPDIAHRHLEQLTSAMIIAQSNATEEPHSHAQADETLMARIGQRAMEVYRQLIHDPGFWPWYTEVSPIAHISALPIASRPVARHSGSVHFENLRAIPWVFAWTQMRFNVPGWYGMGTALSEAIEESDETASVLCRWYREWEFFRTLIDNAQQEMARARLVIAACYDERAATSLYDRIATEFERAKRAVLSITGQRELLDNNPVIKTSIQQRNRPTDLLNLLQIELLQRSQTADPEQKSELRPVLFASINGVAAAMQSTG